jgi:hypothetical protein
MSISWCSDATECTADPSHSGAEAVCARFAGCRLGPEVLTFDDAHQSDMQLDERRQLSNACRGSPLATRVGGIATFGQPRWGDPVAAALFNERFGDRCLRITHASDMVG